jgi:aminoglycoside 6'-N-acetyltransferase I
MDIHPVRTEEYPAWLEMRQALWPDAELEELQVEQDEILAEPEANAVFMATLPEGEPIGFIEVALRHWAEGCSTHPVGYIEGWYVAEAHRRTGVGGALVRAAEAWAGGKGCIEMGSDAEIWNEVSLQAHQALGYQEASRLVTFSKRLAD